MDKNEHWQRVYELKKPDEVSWYSRHLEQSLASIRKVAAGAAKVIDVGGGASTLIEDLLAAGFTDLAVLDISSVALDAAKARLGGRATRVAWILGDVTSIDLPGDSFDVWHDRAVFHFLAQPSERAAYVSCLRKSLKVGGRIVIAAFAPDGPTRCSGLEVMRYDAESLARELGPDFTLEDQLRITHRTPSGSEQKFVHCVFRKVDGAG